MSALLVVALPDRRQDRRQTSAKASQSPVSGPRRVTAWPLRFDRQRRPVRRATPCL